MMSSRSGFRAVVLALAGAGIAAFAGPASAAVIPVACDAAPNGTNLRNAIVSANGTAAADTLDLAAGCTYTYTATSTTAGNALPQVTQPVTINGNGSTVQRTGATNLRLLLINPATAGQTNTINDLTLQGGALAGTNQNGAGIAVLNSTLNLNGVTVQNNTVGTSTALGAGLGGGIATSAVHLNMANSAIKNNTAAHGGGIFLIGGTSTVTNSQVTGNTATFTQGSAATTNIAGGGIYASTAALTIDGGAVSNNTVTSTGSAAAGFQAQAHGGGIYSIGTPAAPAPLLVKGGATIAGNKTQATGTGSSPTGGGIETSAAKLDVTGGSTISGNQSGSGGGILNTVNGGNPALLTTISGSTVSGNTATNGAGIYGFVGPVTVDNGSTISGNTAMGAGGGVLTANAPLNVLGGSTVANNSAASGAGVASSTIAAVSTLPITVTGSTVKDNNATAAGGGIYSLTGAISVNGSSVVSGNKSAGHGGGIYAQASGSFIGSVNISNSAISANEATGTGSTGGGLYALSTPANITGTTFNNNVAAGSTPSPSPGFLYGGGAIYAGAAALNISGSSFLANTANNAAGGAIGAVLNSPVTLTDTTLSGNSAALGGALNASTSQVDITGSTISANNGAAWGGGINNTSGALNITRTSIAGNTTGGTFFGAGLVNTAANATIKRSSITGNSGGAFGAAGLFSGGTSTIENSTVAGNTTSPGSNNTAGGFIVISAGANAGRLDTDNSTFSDNGLGGSTAPGSSLTAWSNSGGANTGGASIHLHNTAVADSDSGPGLGCAGIKNNPASAEPGNLVDEGGNVEWPTAGCPGALRADTKLAPPAADPGQPTFSMRPLPGSSAIDAGTGACPATDQRGTTRPNGAGCDAGAIETPTPPDTTIALIGSDPTADPKFTVGSPDAGAVSFECRTDNQGPWVPCSTPYAPEPPALTDGPHSAQARALDADGYFDTSPASTNFTVDHTGPTVNITPIGVTGDTTPDVSFTVSSDASGIDTVTCEVDNNGNPVPCSSPYTITPALGPGSHTIKVVATDNVGNSGSDEETFTVDSNPPDTIIDSGPSSVFDLGNKTNDSTPTFTFHSTKANSTFQCKIDNGAAVPCTSPYTTPFLADGNHTFSVVATDNVGNVDPTPATVNFIVAPKCSLVALVLNPLGIPIRVCLIETRVAKVGAKTSKVTLSSYSVKLKRGGKTYATQSKAKGGKIKVKRLRKVKPGAYSVRATARTTTGKRLSGAARLVVTKAIARKINRLR